MALQFSTAVRDAINNAVETTIGTSAVIKFFTGTKPATCASANSGTELFTETLPSDWMADSSSGAKALLGTWNAAGIAAGDAGHFRIYSSNGTTCGIQGTVTATGGGGDLTLNNISIAVGQDITITAFTLTAPGA